MEHLTLEEFSKLPLKFKKEYLDELAKVKPTAMKGWDSIGWFKERGNELPPRSKIDMSETKEERAREIHKRMSL